MIVPQGGIWQEIRAMALDAIPARTPITPQQTYSLFQWQSSGYYSCSTASANRIDLDVSTNDFGAALLGDVEHLLDHAAEQKATSVSLIGAANWPSSTWLLVTIYYWAFFSALAFTRIIGRTTWYLDATATARIAATAANRTGTPGAGAYQLEIGIASSATNRAVILKRMRHRLHEAVWFSFYESLAQAQARATLPRANTAEHIFYESLLESRRVLGHDWPSAVRNAINYRPGMAYDSIRGADCLAYARLARPPTARDLQDVVDLHRSALMTLGRPPREISQEPAGYAQLMISFCFLLDALALDLHADIVDRQSLVKQWKRARQRYLERHSVERQGVTWPIDGVG